MENFEQMTEDAFPEFTCEFNRDGENCDKEAEYLWSFKCGCLVNTVKAFCNLHKMWLQQQRHLGKRSRCPNCKRVFHLSQSIQIDTLKKAS